MSFPYCKLQALLGIINIFEEVFKYLLKTSWVMASEDEFKSSSLLLLVEKPVFVIGTK